MIDVEKVIRGLKRCSKGTCPSFMSKEYAECEYTVGLYCGKDRVLADAIELLKSQPQIVRCKDCKYRSIYCTEATDGTTLYTCNHPCANNVPRPADWYCANGKRRNDALTQKGCE